MARSRESVVSWVVVVLLAGLAAGTLGILWHGARAEDAWKPGAPPGQPLFDIWLANAPGVIAANADKPSLDITAIISALVVDSVPGYRTPIRPVSAPTSIGALAATWYGDQKYWPILVAMNLDRVDGKTATATTIVATGTYVFVLLPTLHGRATSMSELWAARGPDLERIYSQWDLLAERDAPYADSLIRDLKLQAEGEELGLAQTSVETGVGETFSAISIRFYRTDRHWKLIRWFNKVGWLGAPVDQKLTATQTLPPHTKLMVPQLLPF